MTLSLSSTRLFGRLSSRHALLRGLPLFAGLSTRELDHLEPLFTLVEVRAGEPLLREGVRSRQFLVVVDGALRVSRETADGDLEMATLRAGEFAGEMSLLERSRPMATVTAVEGGRVLVASASEFSSALLSSPTVAARIRAAAEARRSANAA